MASVGARIISGGIKTFAERHRPGSEPGRLPNIIRSGLNESLEDPIVQDFAMDHVAKALEDGVKEIRTTVTDEIRSAQETHQIDLQSKITDALITPEDGFFRRVFKSIFARFLNLGANISSFVAAGWLSQWTGLTNENEKEQTRWFLNKHLSNFLTTVLGSLSVSEPIPA